MAWETVNGPLGPARLSLEMAYTRSVLINLNVTRKRDRVTWEDCLMFPSPWAEEGGPARTSALRDPRAIAAFFLAWAGAEAPPEMPPVGKGEKASAAPAV